MPGPPWEAQATEIEDACYLDRQKCLRSQHLQDVQYFGYVRITQYVWKCTRPPEKRNEKTVGDNGTGGGNLRASCK